jgi:uncharacterized lipoprotein YehR (DUF1307 family)
MKLLKLTTVIIAAVMAITMTGCGKDGSNTTPVSASADEVKITTTAETTATIPQIDCFEDVEITLSGISPDGKLTIDKENASQDIRKYVSFSSDLSSGIHNGDTIIVTAYYDDGAMRYQQTKEIEADLPFYITDINDYDTSEIITAMDETADKILEKLQPGERVYSADIIGNYSETLVDSWDINTVSWNQSTDYFGTVESDHNAFVRVYNIKVNATKRESYASYDGYENGVTQDFDVYIYVICKGILDKDGVISMPNEPEGSNLYSGYASTSIRPFSTLQDIEDLCDNYFVSYEKFEIEQ